MADSTDLSDAANWYGDSGAMTFAGDATVTLSKDWTADLGDSSMHPGANGLHVVFDLGAENTLTLTNRFSAQYNNGTMELLSGKIVNAANVSNSDATPMGYDFSNWNAQRNNNTFRIKGESAAWEGSMAFNKSTGSRFEVLDGAHFNGGIRWNASTGANILIAGGAVVTNTHVSGAFSPFQGAGSRMVVSNAVLVQSSGSFAAFGGTARGSALEVLDGARVICAGRGMSVGGGAAATDDTVLVTNAFLSVGGSYYCSFKFNGTNNVFTVDDGGVLWVPGSNNHNGRTGNGTDNAYLGFAASSVGNVLRILSGGVVVTPTQANASSDAGAESVGIGWGSKFNVGWDQGSCSNRIEVLGGTARIGVIYVGGKSETSVGNALVVRDGGYVYAPYLYVADTNLLGGASFGGRNSVVIGGAGSQVVTDRAARFYGASELEFDLAEGAFSKIPLVANRGTLQFDAGCSLKIDGAKEIAKAGSATMTLVRRNAGAIALEDGVLEAWNAALAANGETKSCSLSLENGGKDIVLAIASSAATTITLR